MALIKREKRKRRHKRIRAKVSGTSEVPRLYIFKSAKHIYCQLINDEKGQTILNASDLEIKKAKKSKADKKTAIAKEVGKLIAEKALKQKIGKIVFDRGGFIYHGRVKALAEGAREGGLKF